MPAKTRIFKGKTYWYYGKTKTKRKAQAHRDNFKRHGALSRVVEIKDGYAVYWRHTEKSKGKRILALPINY